MLWWPLLVLLLSFTALVELVILLVELLVLDWLWWWCVLVLAAKVLDVRSVDDVIAIAKMATIDNVLAVMYIVAS